MRYREETSWTIRVEAGADFGEGYEGELDGYVWREQLFREVQRRVIGAVLREIAAMPGWRVRTGNQGLPATEEVVVHVELDPDSEAFASPRDG